MLKKLPFLVNIIFILVFPPVIFAQIEQTNDVVVSAFVDIDAFSRLDLNPQNTEVGLESEVKINIVDGKSFPLENHSIEFYIDGDDSSITFVQPVDTNHAGETVGTIKASTTGAYIVRAYDTTYGENISIQDSETLYVFPVPTPELDQEPNYTRGNENTLYWNKVIGIGTYEYYIEVSLDESFNDVVANSGWINTTQDTFTNLTGGTMYFYRIKARNEVNFESSWSALQYSIQDDLSPVIDFEEIEFLLKDELLDGIQVSFDVTDDLELRDVIFYCVLSNGDKEVCGAYEQNGTSYTAIISLEELERTAKYELLDQYSFCIFAIDEAGNESEYCDTKIKVEKEIEPEVPLITTIVNIVIERIEELVEVIFEVVSPQEASTSILIGLVVVESISWLTQIQYFFIQGMSALVSLFGFRKQSQPYGFVYDSVTKEPISRAIIRIYNLEQELIWTDVTDTYGSFSAELKSGEYIIQVRKAGFEFPSTLVLGNTDTPIENIYHGERVRINKKSAILYAIPLDRKEIKLLSRVSEKSKSIFRLIFKRLQEVLFVLGVVIAGYTYNEYPEGINLLVLSLYLPASFVFIKAAFFSKAKFGVVVDNKGKPVKDIQLGLKEREFDRFIGKRITGSDGLYRFLVPSGTYELAVLNKDYEVSKYGESTNVIDVPTKTVNFVIDKKITVERKMFKSMRDNQLGIDKKA